MAQYYHILDYRGLPVEKLAVLVSGLPPESRLMRLVSGTKISPEILLLAAITDRLGILAWMQTKDGHKGRNRPKSILSGLMEPETHEKPLSFSSPAEFEAARMRLLGGDADGG